MHYNSAPDMTRLTRHLAVKRVFKDRPFRLMDIGARDGLKSHWESFLPDVEWMAFEPDRAEAARLAKAPRGYSATVFPCALAGRSGVRQLNVHRNPSSSSLYREDKNFIDRLMLREAFEITSVEAIEVKCIDEMRDRFGDVDFVDIDTEGAELEIFSGGRSLFSDPRLLGVFTEVRFHEGFRTPLFSEVDAFLRSCGFSLFDLGYYHESRRTLPYPLLADKRHDTDSSVRIFGATTHGQVVYGDALYLRDLVATDADAEVEKVLKLSCIMELFAKNDCAAELISHYRSKIDGLTSHAELLELLAAEMSWDRFKYAEYIERYMNHDDAFRPVQAQPRRQTLGEKIYSYFRRP